MNELLHEVADRLEVDANELVAEGLRKGRARRRRGQLIGGTAVAVVAAAAVGIAVPLVGRVSSTGDQDQAFAGDSPSVRSGQTPSAPTCAAGQLQAAWVGPITGTGAEAAEWFQVENVSDQACALGSVQPSSFVAGTQQTPLTVTTDATATSTYALTPTAVLNPHDATTGFVVQRAPECTTRSAGGGEFEFMLGQNVTLTVKVPAQGWAFCGTASVSPVGTSTLEPAGAQ